jgi:LemA protein
MSFNNACENFPSNLVANNFGFKQAEFLDIGDEEKRDAPSVSFG